jgi:protein phosphatase
MVPISIGFKTDPGRKRDKNQDSYAVLRRADLGGKRDALLVVADGMGGVKGGEVASRLVAEAVSEKICEALESWNEPSKNLLIAAIEAANTEVMAKNRAESRTETQRMGTTCVSALLEAQSLTVGNVGDSRAYLLSSGRLFQITQDHSQVWGQVQSGQMTRDEARQSRYRNVVTRMVGIDDLLEPDIFQMNLTEGDILLLCSDGLSSEISDTQIARILATCATPKEACEKLVDAALEAGGSDNITVVVLHYGVFVPHSMRDFPEPTPLNEPEEEESTADPEGKWREALRNARREEREEKPALQPLPAPPPQRPSRLPVALLSLLVLALAGVLAWTWLLYIPKIQKQAEKADLITTKLPAPARTERTLYYGSIAVMSQSSVQAHFLQMDRDSNPIVANGQGLLCRPNSKGGLEPLPSRPLLPTVTQGAIPALFSMGFDASGNRYQYHAPTQSLFKFDPSGTRIRSDIGKGKVPQPTALVISANGDIYLLSRQHLYRIRAYETEKEANPPKASTTNAPKRNP